MNGAKILITGGGGFVGSNLAARLAEAGNEIHIAENLSRRGSELNKKRLLHHGDAIIFHEIEISDVPAFIYREKPNLIYHFAAQVAVTSSVKSPVSDFKINAEGSFHIARAAGDCGISLVYASTNKVYGEHVNAVPIIEGEKRYEFDGVLKGKGIGEDFPIDAAKHTPYGCSKLVGELYTREWGGVANRFSCMYGPHQYGIVDQGWISYFIQKQLKGEPITIFGDGKQVRDVLFVDDVMNLLIKEGDMLLDSSGTDIRGEVFSIGGGHANTISLLELCDILGITPSFGPWRPSDQKVFYADIAKAKRILGWEPKVDYKTGIARLVEWAKQNES